MKADGKERKQEEKEQEEKEQEEKKTGGEA